MELRSYGVKPNALLFIYKLHPPHHPILAKNKPKKQANSSKFRPCTFRFQSIFENAACIQHHFTFLFGRWVVFFASPIICILPLNCTQKVPFYHSLHALPGRKESDKYTIRNAYICKTPCNQQHLAVHLAPNCTAFSGKTQRILRHIARCFAANSRVFAANSIFLCSRFALTCTK